VTFELFVIEMFIYQPSNMYDGVWCSLLNFC